MLQRTRSLGELSLSQLGNVKECQLRSVAVDAIGIPDQYRLDGFVGTNRTGRLDADDQGLDPLRMLPRPVLRATHGIVTLAG